MDKSIKPRAYLPSISNTLQMKTLNAFLCTAALLGLGSARWSDLAVAESSTDFEAFLRNGFQLLTGLSADEARLENNEKGCGDGEKIYEVTCNGAPLLDSTCFGKTIVNVTKIKSEDDIVSYTRKCEGEFHNKTIDSLANMYNMDTVQLCKGKSFVMMKSMKKDAMTSEWKKAFFYSKTCFSKYVIAMKQLPPTPTADHFEVATHCESASHTIVTRQEEKDRKPPTLDNGADLEGAIVTCNCEEANIDEPCEGRFKIVMKKTAKPSENKRRSYRQERRKARLAKPTAETKIETTVETKPPVPPTAQPVVEPTTQPQAVITTAPEALPSTTSEAQPVTSPETVPSAAPEVQPVSTPETSLTAPEVQPVTPPEAEIVAAPEVVPSVGVDEPVLLAPPEAETITLSEPEVSLSFEEQPLVFPGAKKKFEMEKTWTFICDGNWIPFSGVFFQCAGKKQEITESEFYHSSKNCTGMFGASMFDGDKGGYKMCNGKSDFKESITVPALPPMSFVF